MRKINSFLSLFLILKLSLAIDVSSLDPTTQMLEIMGNTNGDNTVFTVSNAGDINGDLKDDFIIGGSGDNCESAYLIYGTSTFPSINIDFKNYVLDPSTVGALFTGNAKWDGFGSVVSDIGDINNDGKNDFMIGAPRKNAYNGAVYVIYGGTNLPNLNFSATTLNPSTTGFTITGDTYGSFMGYSLGKAGKFHSTGSNDIVIGAPYPSANKRGAAIVVYERSSPSNINFSGQDFSAISLSPSGSGLCIVGNANGDEFGTSVSGIGDINKDGYDDIIIGAPGENAGQGAAYVIYGLQSSSTIDLSSQTLAPATTGFKITGNAPGDNFGCSVSSAGDINGDGIPDIIVGACEKDSDKGAAYIIYGRKTPVDIDLSSETLIPATTGFVVRGSAANDQLGFSVKGVRDLNGDSYDEVMIGAPGQSAVHVILGGDPPTLLQNIDLSSESLDPAKNGFTITRNSGGQFGLSVSSGDFNGDGESELFIATSGYGTSGSIGAGYILDLTKMCADNCEKCSIPSTCEVCKTNYELVTGTLQCRECNIGAGEYYDQATLKCGDCLADCETCPDSATCQVCSNGYGRWNLDTECIQCPQTGKYLSGDKTCNNCLLNCDKCADDATCQVCSAGYGRRESDTQCVACPQDGMYLSNGDCLACSEGCLHCEDTSTCLVCAGDFMLSDWHTCVEKTKDSETDTSASVFEGTSLIGASLSSGSSLPLNFGLVAKILRNIKYLNISVSTDLRQTFFSWKVASGALSAPKSWSSKSVSEPLPLVFQRYGLQPVFIINYFKPLLMTLIGLFLFVIFKVIETQLSKKNPKGRWSSISRSINIAASNFALTQYYSNLDDVILYLVIDTRSSKFDSSFRVFSFVLGMVLLTVGLAILGGHVWFLYKYQGFKKNKKEAELEAFKLKHENIDLIFKDFKDLNLSTQSFLLAHIIRSLLSSLSFALLFEYPLFQVLSLLVLNLGMISFLFIQRSFKEILNLIGQLFCEFILLLANICMLVMCIFDQVDSEPLKAIEKLSKCVIALNLALLIGCAVFLLISIGKILYQMYQEKKKKKKKPFEVNSSLNSKLDALRFNHPNRTHHSSEVSVFDLNNDSQIGMFNMNKSTLNEGGGGSFANDTKIEKKIFQETSSWILRENQGEDLVNIGHSNFDLNAAPQKVLRPKRAGRIKMPEGTTLPGYLDYQRRATGGEILRNELLAKMDPHQGENSSHEIESYSGMSLRNLQTRSKRRRMQREDDVIVERMREM